MKGTALLDHRRPPRLLRPFARFFQLEAASGVLLLVAAFTALVWANSPWAGSYFRTWDTYLSIGLGAYALDMSLHHWINDGLMALFFFVVGLEIKREVLIGELASPRQAALSVAAAIGGMLVPAVVYASFNPGGTGAAGWGIPMATDIAFALGVLALLGRRVPTTLKIFVTAVAIVDDLGAILVIAVFYTSEIAAVPLAWAGLTLIGLVAMNRMGVRHATPYALLGILLWLGFLQSGLHATIAGVLLAMTIPAQPSIDVAEFLGRARVYVATIAEGVQSGVAEPTEDQRDAIRSLHMTSAEMETPLTRLEHLLHPWVAFLIVPVFALANAGVTVGDGFVALLGSPVTLGIVAGLIVGKQIGIVGFCWVAVRAGVATLPLGVGWRHIWGVGTLCGIGFTMSLFIATLAFEAVPLLLDAAKVGVLLGSLIAGVWGALLLGRSAPAMHAPDGEVAE